MNDNKYFYVNENSIASKKQYYCDFLNEIQMNNNKILEDREKLIYEISLLKKELLYINKKIKKINGELSIITIDVYVCEDDIVKTIKHENAYCISCNDTEYIVNKLDSLNDKKKKLIEKRKLLVNKKKILKVKVNNDKKRIKDIDIDVKYNNYNMISIKNILYTLDDIVFNGIDVVKERKITPRIKKRRNKF